MNNFDFERRMRAQVLAILKRHAVDVVRFEIANEKQDTKEATDFIVTATVGTIAARVRRPNVPFRDLTIRSRSMFGGTTEIDKLKAGYGDMYFYGWSSIDGLIPEYMILDIHKLRSMGLLERQWGSIPNWDSTEFIAIDFDTLYAAGSGCVIVHTVEGKPGKHYRPQAQKLFEIADQLSNFVAPLRTVS